MDGQMDGFVYPNTQEMHTDQKHTCMSMHVQEMVTFVCTCAYSDSHYCEMISYVSHLDTLWVLEAVALLRMHAHIGTCAYVAVHSAQA